MGFGSLLFEGLRLSLFTVKHIIFEGNNLGKTFRPIKTRNTLVWGLIFIAIIDIPLFFLLFLSSQESTVFFIFTGIIFLLVDGLILSLSFFGSKMTYKLGENEFTVDLGLSKRVIHYASISKVMLSHTALQLRLFGASWPGLHWGLYTTKDVGKVWAYSTKMKGDFVLINLLNGKKIVISPEDPEKFVNEINSWKNKFGTANQSEVESFEISKKAVYFQVFAVAAVFIVFMGYLLWIYPSLPEIIPVHFDINWNINRWAHKSELFILAGVAAIFPILNAVLTIKFGRYGKELTIFLGVIFISVITLFFGIVYFIQTIV